MRDQGELAVPMSSCCRSGGLLISVLEACLGDGGYSVCAREAMDLGATRLCLQRSNVGDRELGCYRMAHIPTRQKPNLQDTYFNRTKTRILLGQRHIFKWGEPTYFRWGVDTYLNGENPHIFAGGKTHIFDGGNPHIFDGGKTHIFDGGKTYIFDGGKTHIFDGGNPHIFDGGKTHI